MPPLPRSHPDMAATPLDIADTLAGLPQLAGLTPARLHDVAAQARWLEAPAGTCLFDAGHACQALPLVLSGTIRVFRRGDNGREISLYRVHPGELCIVTVSCLLGGDAYPATGVTDTPLRAIALPRALFVRLTETHEPFRQAVFHLFSERLSGLMQLVEEVAFRRLDQRLATLLSQRGPVLEVSHHQLADELGSVREIVSRLLKQFEEQGWIRLGRERVDVLAPESLARFGQGQRP